MADVLVVDDDRTVRTLAARMLEATGHSASVVEGGSAALEWLDAQDAEVVLTDVNMPEMDGVTLARAVRTRHPSMPVVGMSGGDWVGEDGVAPFDAFVRKPFEIDELAEAIVQVLSVRVS